MSTIHWNSISKIKPADNTEEISESYLGRTEGGEIVLGEFYEGTFHPYYGLSSYDPERKFIYWAHVGEEIFDGVDAHEH